jgi:hypothetical protein
VEGEFVGASVAKEVEIVMRLLFSECAGRLDIDAGVVLVAGV